MKCPVHGKELELAGYSIVDIVWACPEEDCEHEHEELRDGTNEHLVRELRRSWEHPAGHHDLIDSIRNSH